MSCRLCPKCRTRKVNNNANQASNPNGNFFAGPPERVLKSSEHLPTAVVTQPSPPSVCVIDKLIIRARLSAAYFFQEIVSKFANDSEATGKLRQAVSNVSKELTDMYRQDLKVKYQNFLSTSMTPLHASLVELNYYTAILKIKNETDNILFSSTFSLSVHTGSIESALAVMNQAYEMKKEVWRLIDALFLPFKVLARDQPDCYVDEKGEVTILQEGEAVPAEAVCIKKP